MRYGNRKRTPHGVPFCPCLIRHVRYDTDATRWSVLHIYIYCIRTCMRIRQGHKGSLCTIFFLFLHHFLMLYIYIYTNAVSLSLSNRYSFAIDRKENRDLVIYLYLSFKEVHFLNKSFAIYTSYTYGLYSKMISK